MKIYHNPRCSKSRSGLAILEGSGKPFEVVQYLKTPLDKKQIEVLLKKLDFKPIELVRKNEAIWKEKFKGKDLTDNEIIAAMAAYPKLIERPIVVKGDKAIIGRPPELIKNLL
ncbi:MAG: arsenate reductase (glutaredoxin) [Flavobacteriales bacterium]|nr:MAG: arsenate reductase (glutaredoxin) [Flavobacteriales bacterium]